MYDDLLKLFTSTDQFRPQFCQPNTQGDTTYATDAHSIIAIPNRLCQKDYIAHSKLQTNFASYILRAVHNQHEIVPSNAITDAIAKVPLVDNIEITECDNEDCEDGKVFCPACAHSHDCEDCRGTGEKTRKLTGQIPNPDVDIDMDGVIFSPHLLQRLVHAAKTIDAPIEWVFEDKLKGNLFLVGDISILILPKSHGLNPIKVEL